MGSFVLAGNDADISGLIKLTLLVIWHFKDGKSYAVMMLQKK